VALSRRPSARRFDAVTDATPEAPVQDRTAAVTPALVIYLLIYAALGLLAPTQSPGWAFVADVAYLPFRASTTYLLWVASRRSRDQSIARAFALLTVAQGFAVFGNLTWVYTDLTQRETEDLVYIAWSLPYYACSLTAFWFMMRSGRATRAALTDWLDASVLVVAGAALGWYLIAARLAAAQGGDPAAQMLFFTDTALNVTTAFFAAAIWLRAPAGLARGAGARMAASLAMLTTADLIFQAQDLDGTYRSASILDIWYAVAVILSATAADLQRRHPDGDPLPDAKRADRGDLAVFGAVLLSLVPPLIEVGQARGGPGELPTATIGVVLLMLLILVRQRLARAEIERLVAGRLRLEHQLWQAQKLDAIGRLAGGIAHDFNNILAVISSHAQLMRSTAGKSAGADLAEIEFATERAAVLVRRLLTFSTASSPAQRPVVLGDVVTQMQQMLRQLLVSGVTLEFRITDDAATVTLAEGQLEQVLLNLTVNARDATEAGGVVTVTTARVHVTPRSELNRRGLAPGTWAALEVRDTGSGMDAATQARLFEPFFTTKANAGGTGLGLATVAGIVEAAQGRIMVESVPGNGTTMRVFLPIGPEAAPTTAPHTRSESKSSQRGTLLIVDDELPIRSALTRYLSRLGYRVLEAADVTQGVSQLEQHDWQVDLVLTDVRMPDQTGLEMAARVRARRPDIPVLFMTGHADSVRASSAPPRADTIDKPFDLDVVAERVRTRLAEAAAER
jgi:signal transduction histidine kinase/CheY-like chemotaxis protein